MLAQDPGGDARLLPFLMEIITPILTAIISAIAVILPAYWLHSQREKSRAIQIKALEDKVIALEHFSSDAIRIRLATINALQMLVSDLFKGSGADRFLILVAYNGSQAVKWASVIYEQHQNTIKVNYSLGAARKYHNLPLDDVYRDMLHKAEQKGYSYEKTDEMHDSLLKDIYIEEKVSESRVDWVRRKEIKNGKDLIIYTSTATHQPDGFTPIDKRRVRISIAAIKDLIYKEFDDVLEIK